MEIENSLYKRFKPNLLYSEQPFSVTELEVFRSICAFVKNTYPKYNELINDPLIVCFSSAHLLNMSSYSEVQSCINLDIEFLRLANLVTSSIDEIGSDNNKIFNYLELADRILFHSIIRSGKYEILHSIPVLSATPQIQKSSSDIALYGMCFLLTHEIEHLRLLTDQKHFTALKSSFQFQDLEDIHGLFSKIQLNYGGFFESYYKKKIEVPFDVTIDYIRNAANPVMNEILCDQLAISISFILMMKLEQYDVRVGKSIVGIHCLSALLQLTENLLLIENEDLTTIDLAEIRNFSLRELAVNSFTAEIILYLTEEQSKKEVFDEFLSLIIAKNKTLSQFMNLIFQRMFLFKKINRNGKEVSIRKLIRCFGYFHNRTSILLSEQFKDVNG